MNSDVRLQYLLSLLQNDPNDAFLNYAVALEYLQTDRTQEGLDILEKLRVEQPTYTATYYQLASAYIERNQIEKAKAVIEQGMQLTKQSDVKTHNELRALLEDLD